MWIIVIKATGQAEKYWGWGGFSANCCFWRYPWEELPSEDFVCWYLEEAGGWDFIPELWVYLLDVWISPPFLYDRAILHVKVFDFRFQYFEATPTQLKYSNCTSIFSWLLSKKRVAKIAKNAATGALAMLPASTSALHNSSRSRMV